MNTFTNLVLTLLLFSVQSAWGQTDSSRFRLIASLCEHIKFNYVSDELAQEMCDTIQWKMANNRYDATLNIDEFTYELTKDLRRVSHDRHISVMRPVAIDYNSVTEQKRYEKLSKNERAKEYKKNSDRLIKEMHKINKRTKDDMFSYGDIKILPGNVGYVEIKDFSSTSYDRQENKGRIALEDVMKFLQFTDAIIIDRRNNSGGRVDMAAKLCSYFSLIRGNYFITSETHYSSFDKSGTRKPETKKNIIISMKQLMTGLQEAKRFLHSQVKERFQLRNSVRIKSGSTIPIAR